MMASINKTAVFALLFVLMALALAPFVAFGLEPTVTPSPTTEGPVATIDEGIELFDQVLVWFATIFWIAAALFVLYAAFLYLTAAGNEEKVKKASSQLLYAVIAIAVGLMAYGLPALVQSVLEG